MTIVRTPRQRRTIRHLRVRRKIGGTPQRPRLSVFRSLTHVYAQVIDDTNGVTLVSATSMEPDLKEQAAGKPKTTASALVGTLIAQRAREKGITTAVFDRGGYKYHGRVKALAEAARKGGLVI